MGFSFKPKTLAGLHTTEWGDIKGVTAVQLLKDANRVVAFLVDNNEDMASIISTPNAGATILKALVLQLSSNLKFNFPENKTPQAFLEDNGVRFEGTPAVQRTSLNNFLAALRLAFIKIFEPWMSKTITSEAEKALGKAHAAAAADVAQQVIIKAKMDLLTAFTAEYKVAAACKELSDLGSASAEPALFAIITSFRDSQTMLPQDFLAQCSTAVEEDYHFSLLPDITNHRSSAKRLQEALRKRVLDDVDGITNSLARLLDETAAPEWDDLLDLLRPWSRAAEGRAERAVTERLARGPSVNWTQGSFPECEHCGKTSHPADHCFKKYPSLFEEYSKGRNAPRQDVKVAAAKDVSKSELATLGKRQFKEANLKPEMTLILKHISDLSSKQQSSLGKLPKDQLLNRVQKAIIDLAMEIDGA
mmetsp:Transcript_10163/g.24859  ORF Transcript_10163/g.24859 Transcript_10163/m.24859 type:complete len:418 (-) Transcript_10163:64-1317(-)|eukprot:CAMPEP_0180133102 /NCGR_PEP_ID=MMETSP0986-20121125/9352_1 /TAXON_ID=697907 /ORGANISM="non described non described, Strain CCMP2293" /LENGTH=417 /DNA_ID=CAMNT_0022073179 /DNA_START=657 /DNA_END=1910 /DNA_ORIENTATION=+